MAFELPALPYGEDALEPHIDARTMGIHHGKHHHAYVSKLNGAIEGNADLAGKSIEELIGNLDAGTFELCLHSGRRRRRYPAAKETPR